MLERIACLAAERACVDHLYTMFDTGKPLSPTVDRINHRASFLRLFPPGIRRWLLPFYPAAVGSLGKTLARDHRTHPIDLLISTSSAAIKGLRAPPGIAHMCYCHAPARYIWSIRDEYALGQGLVSRLAQLGLTMASPSYKRWDRASAGHVTQFLANSTHTQAEIQRCFGCESEVVYPPVRTDLFTPDSTVSRDSFWLFVGALEPYKRLDLAIAAARHAGAKLVVAGTGSLEKTLRRSRPDPHIQLLGRVSDGQLVRLLRSAQLLIYPQIEDFGITAVEAQACGCPVVARRAGGALDTVVDGTTGAFFDDPAPVAIARAAAACPHDASACRIQAERFGEEVFDDAIRKQLDHFLPR